MARRVSLKGKGADLFFGDHPPGVDTGAQEGQDETTNAAVSDDSELDVSRSDSPAVSAEDTAMVATEPEAETALDEPHSAVAQQAGVDREVEPLALPEPDGILSSGEAELFDTMWARLASQASISNSFRYTAPELEEMADVLYQVSKDVRARLTKQDIARLGLNVVLWDYRRRGDASWLSEFARRKRRPEES